jgi:ElaB/YqjD/DUF883 family membrane-anchored ribosome-binding protein
METNNNETGNVVPEASEVLAKHKWAMLGTCSLYRIESGELVEPPVSDLTSAMAGDDAAMLLAATLEDMLKKSVPPTQQGLIGSMLLSGLAKSSPKEYFPEWLTSALASLSEAIENYLQSWGNLSEEEYKAVKEGELAALGISIDEEGDEETESEPVETAETDEYIGEQVSDTIIL